MTVVAISSTLVGGDGSDSFLMFPPAPYACPCINGNPSPGQGGDAVVAATYFDSYSTETPGNGGQVIVTGNPTSIQWGEQPAGQPVRAANSHVLGFAMSSTSPMRIGQPWTLRFGPAGPSILLFGAPARPTALTDAGLVYTNTTSLIPPGATLFNFQRALGMIDTETAVAAGLPLISAAISQWEGQIGLFDTKSGGPCYRCVFPEPAAPGLAPSCAEGGVLGPLPGVLGTMMAVEAVKHLTGAGETLKGRMLIYDALYGEVRMITLSRVPDCVTCG